MSKLKAVAGAIGRAGTRMFSTESGAGKRTLSGAVNEAQQAAQKIASLGNQPGEGGKLARQVAEALLANKEFAKRSGDEGGPAQESTRISDEVFASLRDLGTPLSRRVIELLQSENKKQKNGEDDYATLAQKIIMQERAKELATKRANMSNLTDDEFFAKLFALSQEEEQRGLGPEIEVITGEGEARGGSSYSPAELVLAGANPALGRRSFSTLVSTEKFDPSKQKVYMPTKDRVKLAKADAYAYGSENRISNGEPWPQDKALNGSVFPAEFGGYFEDAKASSGEKLASLELVHLTSKAARNAFTNFVEANKNQLLAANVNANPRSL